MITSFFGAHEQKSYCSFSNSTWLDYVVVSVRKPHLPLQIGFSNNTTKKATVESEMNIWLIFFCWSPLLLVTHILRLQLDESTACRASASNGFWLIRTERIKEYMYTYIGSTNQWWKICNRVTCMKFINVSMCICVSDRICISVILRSRRLAQHSHGVDRSCDLGWFQWSEWDVPAEESQNLPPIFVADEIWLLGVMYLKFDFFHQEY